MTALRLVEYLGVILATIFLLLYAVRVFTGKWPWTKAEEKEPEENPKATTTDEL